MWNSRDVLRGVARGRNGQKLSRADAERLLDGAPAAADGFAALATLLAAAAGPPQLHERAGERAARTAFTKEYRPRSQPQPVPRTGLRLGVAVTVSAAALLLAGTAYAAGAGQLPEVLQRAVQDLLPGAGSPTSGASVTVSPAAGSGHSMPNPSSGPATHPSSAAIDVTQQLSLCRSWMAFRADPHAKPVTAQERHALAAAAGGENAINEFCERLLTPTPEPTPTTVKPGNPAPGSGKPTHPEKSPPR